MKKTRVLNAINRKSQDLLPAQVEAARKAIGTGNIFKIIPDMIETGLDVLAPVQPEAMDQGKLPEKFGKSLTFFGGISTQKTLSFGNLGDIRKEIIERIKVLGASNGYIIAPSHEVTSDCKNENFLMLLSTLKEYREGGI